MIIATASLEASFMCKSAEGLVVPIPTFPPEVAMEVAPEEVSVVNAPVDAELAPIVVPSIAPPLISLEEPIASN